MELLVRTAPIDLSSDGRNLEGLAFPWDRPSMVTDDGGRTRYLEEFSQRSADQTLKMRADRPLFVAHEYLKGSVGEVSFRPSGEGLVFYARMSDTNYAKQTLQDVNDGKLRAVSVGFRPIRSGKRSDPSGLVTVRNEIAIEELSLAQQGQHEDALVLAVRAIEGTPRLDALRKKKLILL